MAQPFDIKRLADRLASAAERVSGSPHGLGTEATMDALVIFAGEPGGPRSVANCEAVPFGALFHDEEDKLAQAISRLEKRNAA